MSYEDLERRLAILEAKVDGKDHKCNDDRKVMCKECGKLICCRSYLCDKDSGQNYEIGYYPDTCSSCVRLRCKAEKEAIEAQEEETRVYYSRYKEIPFVGNIVYALLLWCNTPDKDKYKLD
jgi:hypothetical protein